MNKKCPECQCEAYNDGRENHMLWCSKNQPINPVEPEPNNLKPREERCTKCNAPFLPHEHKHITRKGIYHTSCYEKRDEPQEKKPECKHDFDLHGECRHCHKGAGSIAAKVIIEKGNAPTPPVLEEKEIDFDYQFGEFWRGEIQYHYDLHFETGDESRIIDGIKSFIKSLISKAREESYLKGRADQAASIELGTLSK